MVPVPAGAGASVSFAAGILDAAIGLRQGPMTFKVEVNELYFGNRTFPLVAGKPAASI